MLKQVLAHKLQQRTKHHRLEGSECELSPNLGDFGQVSEILNLSFFISERNLVSVLREIFVKMRQDSV